MGIPSLASRFAGPARRSALLGAVLLAAGCAQMPGPGQLTYVVFFTAFSADLDDPAKTVIADAAKAAAAAPGKQVIVQGYADRIGSPESNVTLSRLRGQVVADGLVAQGVARERILLRPKGPQGGDPGIESRRVEIGIAR